MSHLKKNSFFVLIGEKCCAKLVIFFYFDCVTCSFSVSGSEPSRAARVLSVNQSINQVIPFSLSSAAIDQYIQTCTLAFLLSRAPVWTGPDDRQPLLEAERSGQQAEREGSLQRTLQALRSLQHHQDGVQPAAHHILQQPLAWRWDFEKHIIIVIVLMKKKKIFRCPGCYI